MKIDKEHALIDGRPLLYRVRKHSRARRASVTVSRREGVVVTLPARAAHAYASEVIADCAVWVAGKADKYGVWNGPIARQYASGSPILVFGRQRSLQLEPLPTGRKRAVAHLDEDLLTLRMPPPAILDPLPEISKYLRALAKRDLPPRVDRWAGVVGWAPLRVIIGERKSRWGSCSPRGTISLCYRLVMAPPETIDAVVAHEVCHLVHMNHSARFYSLLDSVCPGHREAMEWLSEHHDELLL